MVYRATPRWLGGSAPPPAVRLRCRGLAPMADEIVLKLPDGMAKVLTPEEAQQTVEPLWNLGLTSGAVIRAVRIFEALEAPNY
jgi:hypothetical protein